MNSFSFLTSLYHWDYLPIPVFLKVLKRFPTSNQVLNWFPDIFVEIVSLLFNKVLFGPSLLLFIKNSFYFVFLIGCYLSRLKPSATAAALPHGGGHHLYRSQNHCK